MLVEATPQGGIEHFGAEVWEKLVLFKDLLVAEGEKRGLIGPRELDKLWSRHILNSTAILDYIDDGSSVADVGSGAGFPGLVAAIVRPDLDLHLIDSLGRRTDWLLYAVDELDLENVKIFNNRAEELVGKVTCDVVTARAVAALKKLLPWTMPLTKPGGKLVLLKGGRAEIEIDDADKQLRKFNAEWVDLYNVDVWGTSESTRVVVVKRK